ncbi:MAG TPA: inositol monophosphatase family protein [Solirubrobacterales bacterium]|nr:inositol monophosphatase family protein [Solirubrobacterales bacterium]
MRNESIRNLVVDLAATLREEVLPHLGAHAARAHSGEAEGGDVTFQIDEHAERRMEEFLAERAPEISFYSEDRGLVSPAGDRAEWVLVVDPIDGTRPALAGLESCCVSVAAAPLDSEPAMGDVRVGCVLELKSGMSFVAERGGGLEPAANLSANRSLERMFWTYGFRGRPARALVEVLAELIDASSVGGGTFDLGSATYDMTRIVTGQLDAYVEPGPRMIDDVPEIRVEFERVGDGAVLNNSPYDLAAATICLEECGATVTDAYGEPLRDRPLLGSGHDFQMSCVAAANAELHSAICAEIDAGIERLRAHI